MKEHETAGFQIVPVAGGNRYRFFCDLSGAVLCTTAPVRGDSPEEELRMAWEQEGHQHFNQCHRCGRWVSDVMYNADELQCVECAAWVDRPRYCIRCGARLREGDPNCPACGRAVNGGESGAE